MERHSVKRDWTIPPQRALRGALHAGPTVSEQALLAQIMTHSLASGYELAPLLVTDYWIALKTSPFVVVFGPAGVGKSDLPQLVAQALTRPSDDQYIYVNLGLNTNLHIDLQDRFGWMKLVELLETASTSANAGRIFFLCLDNLRPSDIETYFAPLVEPNSDGHYRLAIKGYRPDEWPVIPPNVVLTGVLDASPPINFVNSLVGRAACVYIEPRWLRDDQHVAQLQRSIAPVGYQRVLLTRALRTEQAAAAFLETLVDDLEDALQLPPELQAILWQSGVTYDKAWRGATLRAVANSFGADGQGLFIPHNRRDNLRFALIWSVARQLLLRLWGQAEHMQRIDAILQSHLQQLPRQPLAAETFYR